MQKLKKVVVIKRSKWARRNSRGKQLGMDEGRNALRLPHSKRMCCLGFVCSQVYGIPSRMLSNTPMPVDLLNRWITRKDKKTRIHFSSMELGVFETCQIINDKCSPSQYSGAEAYNLTDKEQENLIAENLKKLGITAKFIP